MERKRLSRENGVLVAIDFQERLLPAMQDREALTDASRRLIQGFGILNVPVILTQQYPKGLGETVEEIRSCCPEATVIDKVSFSAWGEEAFVKAFHWLDKDVAVVIGIEAHVCEQQTVLDLLDAGYTVYVAADCVASRKNTDRDIALDMMRQAGAVITTAEAILFELLETSKAEEFKAISALVK